MESENPGLEGNEGERFPELTVQPGASFEPDIVTGNMESIDDRMLLTPETLTTSGIQPRMASPRLLAHFTYEQSPLALYVSILFLITI